MAPQIFRHDDEPRGDLGLGLQGPAILTSRRSASGGLKARSSTTTSAAVAPATTRLDSKAPLPPVVLTLPELSGDDSLEESRGVDLPNIVSWAAIILGAAIAVTLIVTAPKSAAPPTDDAPAWQSPTNNSGQAPSSDGANPSSSGSPRSSTARPLGLAVDDSPRTARLPDAARASAVDAAAEAAPVGRITNIAVPQ